MRHPQEGKERQPVLTREAHPFGRVLLAAQIVLKPKMRIVVPHGPIRAASTIANSATSKSSNFEDGRPSSASERMGSHARLIRCLCHRMRERTRATPLGRTPEARLQRRDPDVLTRPEVVTTVPAESKSRTQEGRGTQRPYPATSI